MFYSYEGKNFLCDTCLTCSSRLPTTYHTCGSTWIVIRLPVWLNAVCIQHQTPIPTTNLEMSMIDCFWSSNVVPINYINSVPTDHKFNENVTFDFKSIYYFKFIQHDVEEVVVLNIILMHLNVVYVGTL